MKDQDEVWTGRVDNSIFIGKEENKILVYKNRHKSTSIDMTFTNDLENQIKFLICLESKAGSGTSLCLMMQTIREK